MTDMSLTPEQERLLADLEATFSIPPGMAVICLDCGHYFNRARKTCPRCASEVAPFDVSQVVDRTKGTDKAGEP